ncbi:hypothetical protein ACFSTE_01995 [Aquimarina hainanensis]|uniref:Beta-lactamase-inhibitor-like PepSY-like domain-containing protein n=1 Tax=Aquimarina hainanensis TaxID=1578017 RepID=A0ABW5N5V4_9FLAO|nr:hypothetical protein [Aquimarina sp. TRL1]QKX04311.1 hypothetical protein HN014_05095 [Aquimarina sp. TRL1]
MKNLFLTPILIIGILIGLENVSAQNAPQEGISTEKEIASIPVKELPETITKAVERDYKGAVINKSTRSDKTSFYELKLAYKNGETLVINYDPKGNLIKK